MSRLIALLLIVLVALPAPLLAWIPRCLPDGESAPASCAPPACVVVPECRASLACDASDECPPPCEDQTCLPRDCQGCAIFVTFFCEGEAVTLIPVQRSTLLNRSLAQRAQARRERPLLPPPK